MVPTNNKADDDENTQYRLTDEAKAGMDWLKETGQLKAGFSPLLEAFVAGANWAREAMEKG